MTLREKLLALLKMAYEEEQKLCTSLDENEKSATGKLDKWSAKDMMSHIVYWKENMVRNITATLHNENPDVRGDLNTINEEIFEANKNNSWDDTLKNLERAHKSAIKCVSSVPDEMLIDANTLPWQENRLIWRIIAGNGYMHPNTHLAEYYFRRGNSNYAVKLHEHEADFTRELSDNPEWLGIVVYNLACGYALAGHQNKAIDKLREAFKLNPSLAEWSKEDSDLDSIRKYNDYKSLCRLKE